MNKSGYWAVVNRDRSSGVWRVPASFVRIAGRDRASFLQGQISNDVLQAKTGSVVPACLLNNTGHLLSYLTVYFFDDYILLATEAQRSSVVRKTLDRYVVRERVEIDEVSMTQLTIQGQTSTPVLATLIDDDITSTDSSSFQIAQTGFGEVTISRRQRFTANSGFDLIMDGEFAPRIESAMLSIEGVVPISDADAEILRVESGELKWGAELDESVIPLEAGLDRAISYTKGCYMGQEVIARIHSRGHTNRSLTGLKFATACEAGAALIALDGTKEGLDVGRITSAIDSPRFGTIGLGYVRNEYLQLGTKLSSKFGFVVTAPLPIAES